MRRKNAPDECSKTSGRGSDIERDDDKDDAGDVALIDESEEGEADARDIIGGDIKNEEGN
jgi:hypothetical protein